MKAVRSNLYPGSSGADVANLQVALAVFVDRDLIHLDDAERQEILPAFDQERAVQVYGPGTRRLVVLFRVAFHLNDLDDVDGPTAAAMNKLLDELGLLDGDGRFIVRGSVTFSDGRPAAAFCVQAVDRDLRADELLGETVVSVQGRYEIVYYSSQFLRAEKGSADLQVKVFNPDGENPQLSAVRFNAGPEETVDFVLDMTDHPLSEFELLLADLAPVLGEVKLIELTGADIDFLAGETGRERQQIDSLAAAARSDQQLRALDGVVVTIADPLLITAAFYTWSRLGQPSTLAELLRLAPGALIELLKQGIDRRIAPARLAEYIEELGRILAAARAQAQIAPDPRQAAAPGLGELAGMLSGQEAMDADTLRKFASFQDGLAPGNRLWQTSRAEKVLTGPQVEGLQSVVALHLVTGGDRGLLGAAKAHLPQVDAGSFDSPVLRVAAMEPADWQAVLKKAGAPGKPEELDDRAAALTEQAARLMPTDFLLIRAARAPQAAQLAPRLDSLAALKKLNKKDLFDHPFDQLNTNGLSDAEKKQAKETFTHLQKLANLHPGLRINAVLGQNAPADKISAEVQRRVGLLENVYRLNPGVDFLALDYLPGSADRKSIRFGNLKDTERGWVVNSLKAYQRSFRVAGSARLAVTTLEAGYQSAAAIADTELEEFRSRTGLSLPEAYQVHEAARDRALDSGLQLMAIHDYIVFTGGKNGSQYPWNSLEPASNVIDYLKRLEGFDKLFGQLNSCRCDHCNSIFSPAAYFVDLMRFVDKKVTKQVFTGAKENHPLSLRTRRPDLWTLEFTCENSLTLIPTLDIINEILENTIAGEKNPRSDRRPAIQRTVYEKLAAAKDSFQQPFVLPLRRLEIYLSHFERTRAEVAQALGVDPDVQARTRLGLSLAEWRLIAPNPAAVDQAFLTKLYGNPIAQNLNQAKEIDVQEFLKRTPWTRDELGQLLCADFVRQNNPVSFFSKKRDPQNSIQNDQEIVKGLDFDLLDRLHRFTRLWRKLGWQVAELDQALYHFRPGGGAALALGKNQLISIAGLAALGQRFPALSLEEACVLVADFPPPNKFGRLTPLFDRLFNLEPFVTQDGRWSADPNAIPPNPTFTHPAFASGNSQPNNRILQRLLAGLQVTDQELVDLMKKLNLLDNANALALTPANLSLLYRHARLVRLLNLSVLELAQLLELGRVGSPAPYRVEDMDDLQTLLDTYDAIRASGFTQDDLAFITGVDPLKPDNYPSETKLAAEITRQIRQERAVEFDITVFTQLDGVTEAESRNFVTRNSAPAGTAFEFVAESQRWRMKKEFDPTSGALSQPASGSVPEQKVRALLDGYHPRGLLPGRIAAQLSLPVEKILLMGELVSPLLTAHNADLCAELQAGQPDRPAPKLMKLIRILLPLAVLFRSPVFDEDALTFVDAHPDIFDLTKPATPDQLTIRLRAALRAARYTRLAGVSEPDFTPEKPAPDPAAVRRVLLKDLTFPGGIQPADISDLAQALRVSTAQVGALYPHLKLSSEPFESLARMQACLALAGFLGVSGETLKLIVPSAPTPQQLTPNTEYAALTSAAEGVYGVIRAKYPDEQVFLQKVEAFDDQIRSLKRDGLVEYMIRSAKQNFYTPEDLYQYLLIDTQMEGCARTSRVVAASSSLQLYIHRVLMNLEQSGPEDPNPVHVQPGLIPDEWSWRKNYRVWEANRKVFLYPENYIEPELRDDKTPLFEELEANLLQRQISEDSATDAYATYLKGFDEIARLKIAGAYHQVSWETRRDRLHLVGVTPADPPEFYYRTIENARYGETEPDRRTSYNPWRKIDIQIPLRKVAPVIHEGRLYIFWVKIKTIPRSQLFNGESRFLGYKHTLALQYTTARLNGGWTPPQTIDLANPALFPAGEGVVMDPLKIILTHINSSAPAQRQQIPIMDPLQRNHEDAIDGYALSGPLWDQFYPMDADDSGLLITGRNFRIFAQVDLFERTLKAPPKLAFGYPPRVLYAKDTQAGRLLYEALDIPLIFTGGPYPDASLMLERSRLEQMENTGEWQVGLANRVESSFHFDDIAQLNAEDELMVINGSTEDCLIYANNDLLWLKGSVRKAPEYLLRRLGTTISSVISRRLLEQGLDKMLDTQFQVDELAEADSPIRLRKNITNALNTGIVDFTGPLGTYFREIFFHIPFLVANHLNSQQRFSAAQRWYHYIFNPTSDDTSPFRVWRYREFRRDLNPKSLRDVLTDQQALDAYRNDPFNPHAIARLRLSAYQKSIVMKYIDNLLDWGDSLFTEFTMESVNEAAMLYIMAADILGPRPADVGSCSAGEVSPKNYETIAPDLDENDEILIELEHFVRGMIGGRAPKQAFEFTRFGNSGVIAYASQPLVAAPPAGGAAGMPAAVGGMGPADAAGAAGPAGVPGGGAPGGAYGGLPGLPLDWRQPSGSYWTMTGGMPLSKLNSYQPNLGQPPTLTPAGDGDGGQVPPQVTGVFGPTRPGGPLLPPGSLHPEDYKLPGTRDFERQKPWEFNPLEPPDRDLGKPVKPAHPVPHGGDFFRTSLLFCIPDNKDLSAYWDRVDDRLTKIRNCMDITGARRQLDLFAPEIDPRLLVRMRAAGLSLEDVLSVTSGSVPPYRFTFMIDKARQYAGTVQSLGSALLAALEKKDGEELSQLRATHEQNLLKQRSSLMDWEIQAAQDTLDSLNRQKAAAEYRQGYYENLLQTGHNPWEITQEITQHSANALLLVSALLSGAGGVFALIPQLGAPTAMKYGGVELKGSTEAWADMFHDTAGLLQLAASSAGLEATFARRAEEWGHQKQLAKNEIESLKKQIDAAGLRLEIAQRSKDVHEVSISQAEEVYEYYRDKFSSLGLYTYLSAMLNRRYREAYNAAFAAAKMAEQAYRFERPGDDAALLTNDYWDAAQSGLLAGERLLLDLQNLERRFLETNYRSLEIEQSFSLMQLAPSALLELRQTGECQFGISEFFFDLAYPGHYLRRIKGVRLTIPCVAGPLTNIGAELRLTGSQIRLRPATGQLDNLPLRHTRAIAASSAQNDSGVFEFNFRDERYMPFEGAGAISQWQLTLPKNFPSFDYQTISDVIVRISYTAEEDSDWRAQVEDRQGNAAENLASLLKNPGQKRLFSLRHEFPDVWQQVVKSPVKTAIQLEIGERHLPYLVAALKRRNVQLAQSAVDVLLQCDTAPTLKLNLDTQDLTNWSKEVDGLYKATTTPVTLESTHTLSITDSGNMKAGGAVPGTIDPSVLKDIFLRMEIKTKN